MALLALVAGQDVEPVDGGRRHRRAVADRAAGRPGPGHLHRRPAGPACAQDRLPPPGRVQGPCGDRAGHRHHHRLRADQGRRRRPRTAAGQRGRAPAWSCSPARPSRCTVLADSAYGSGEFRAELAERGHTDRVKPGPDPSATPAGSPSTTSPSTRRRHRHLPGRGDPPDQPQPQSPPSAPPARLPAAGRCTTQPHRHEPEDPTTRRAPTRRPPSRAADPDLQAEYRQHRPMVERAIAWLTRGNRRLRYRGVIKNDPGCTTAPPRSTSAA